MRTSFILLSVCGALAFGILLWAYLTPMTGITGTSGAALGAIGAGAIALGGLLKAAVPGPGGFPALMTFLLLLAILGTGLAAWFLLQYHVLLLVAVLALMVVGLLALIAGASRVAKLDAGDAL